MYYCWGLSRHAETVFLGYLCPTMTAPFYYDIFGFSVFLYDIKGALPTHIIPVLPIYLYSTMEDLYSHVILGYPINILQ